MTADLAKEIAVTIWDVLPAAVSRLPGEVRWRAENALEMSRRALELFEIDRRAATFWAVTAEEEAATAVIRSLKLRGYPGAEHLNRHDHRHKAAVDLLFKAIWRELRRGEATGFHLHLNPDCPSLHVIIPTTQFGVGDFYLEVVPPFGLVTVPAPGQPHHLEDEALDKLFNRSFRHVVKSHAKARNFLLYASDTGPPEEGDVASAIARRGRNVEAALLVLIGILQTETHQPMVIEALNTALRLVIPIPAGPNHPAARFSLPTA